jgi:hypothetical protein
MFGGCLYDDFVSFQAAGAMKTAGLQADLIPSQLVYGKRSLEVLLRFYGRAHEANSMGEMERTE